MAKLIQVGEDFQGQTVHSSHFRIHDDVPPDVPVLSWIYRPDNREPAGFTCGEALGLILQNGVMSIVRRWR